jgi:general secretion pathway protein G
MRNSRSLRRPQTRRSQAGMTLIEIIVVIVLIGGVLALVGNQVFKNQDRANFRLAEVQVKKVASNIETYNSDVGEYPRSLDDLITDPGVSGWLGPYGSTSDLKDPWKKSLEYNTPGEDGPFDLKSLGKDGRPGGGNVDADIVYKQ